MTQEEKDKIEAASGMFVISGAMSIELIKFLGKCQVKMLEKWRKAQAKGGIAQYLRDARQEDIPFSVSVKFGLPANMEQPWAEVDMDGYWKLLQAAEVLYPPRGS